MQCDAFVHRWLRWVGVCRVLWGVMSAVCCVLVCVCYRPWAGAIVLWNMLSCSVSVSRESVDSFTGHVWCGRTSTACYVCPCVRAVCIVSLGVGCQCVRMQRYPPLVVARVRPLSVLLS